MIQKRYVLVILAVLLLSSCADLSPTYYYHPALLNNDVAYLPKPLSTDSSKTAKYISVGVVSGIEPDVFDHYTYGTLNLSMAHTFKHLNIAYGAYGFSGTYGTTQFGDTIRNGFNSKNFYGYGGRVSINAFKHYGIADIRFIGLEAHYSHESGSYANFRNTFYGAQSYYIDKSTDLLTVGATTEVSWHGADDTNIQYGFRGFAGTTLGNHNLYNSRSDYSYWSSSSEHINFSASFYFQHHQLFAIVENGGSEHTSLRIGYRF